MNMTLADGFSMRAPTTDDLDALAALLVAHDQARYGKAPWLPPAARDWIASVWATPSFDVASDARVVISPVGEIAGYITLWRPDGASGHFVASPRWAEPLARQRAAALPPYVAAAVHSWVKGPDQAAEDLLVREGFTLAQRHLRMEITMQAPLPAPVWPSGVSARPFVAGQDERAVFDLMQAAFAETENSELSFEEWSREIFAPESADPSLWTLADNGDGLVGAAINRADTGDDGIIGRLEGVGVHPAWRKRGLGLALLYHSFDDFYQRGISRCGLAVDAQNASGATRLYTCAGMAVQPRQEIRYTKPLR